jgi:hypothetical protein
LALQQEAAPIAAVSASNAGTLLSKFVLCGQEYVSAQEVVKEDRFKKITIEDAAGTGVIFGAIIWIISFIFMSIDVFRVHPWENPPATSNIVNVVALLIVTLLFAVSTTFALYYVFIFLYNRFGRDNHEVRQIRSARIAKQIYQTVESTGSQWRDVYEKEVQLRIHTNLS